MTNQPTPHDRMNVTAFMAAGLGVKCPACPPSDPSRPLAVNCARHEWYQVA